MQSICAQRLEETRVLFEYGMSGEALENLVTLRRCAVASDCPSAGLCGQAVSRHWPVTTRPASAPTAH